MSDKEIDKAIEDMFIDGMGVVFQSTEGSRHIPIGDIRKEYLESGARDIAEKFNNAFEKEFLRDISST